MSTIAALLIVSLELAFAALAGTIAVAVPTLKLPILAGFIATLVVAFVAAARISSLLASRRKRFSSLDQLDGLSGPELRALLALAAPIYQFVGAVGLTSLVLLLVLVGPISWSTSEPFTQSIAVGVALYTASLSALFTPVLAGLAQHKATIGTP